MTAINLPVNGCRSRSRFGACNRERHAPGQVHFVDMGNSFGFGYRSASGHSTPVGYGRLSSDGTVFTPTSGGVKTAPARTQPSWGW